MPKRYTSGPKTDLKGADISSIQELLLPWYNNGTLSATEKAHIEQERQHSGYFNEIVLAEKALAEQWAKEVPDLSDLMSQQSLASRNLMERVAAQKKNTQQSQSTFPSPTHMSWVSSVACLLLVLVSSVWLLNFKPKSDDFQVQTQTPAGGLVLQVVFKPDFTHQQIQTLLTEASLPMISGPSVNRVYRLSIHDASVLQYWQQHPAVAWAGVEVQ
jgi:hypothetical protein